MWLGWSQPHGWRWSLVSDIAWSQASRSLLLWLGLHWRDDAAIFFLSSCTQNVQPDHGTSKAWENPLWKHWCTVLEMNMLTSHFSLPNELQVPCKINYCKFHGTNFEKMFSLLILFLTYQENTLWQRKQRLKTHARKGNGYNS